MQLKKENNIKTFEKHKLNVVGVGVPDDPQIKQKHINKITSNLPTSNIKFPTSNSAITLIALIITIIVLLILAGVTLNMVMGDSGIFSKANQAKNKTEVAQYEEELRMCVLELQTDAATNGTTFGIDTIRKNLVEKVKELENTEEIEITSPEGNATIEGTYKGYEYKIDEKYVVHIGDKATGIILTTSLEPKGWTNQNVTATITIKSNNGINKVEPDEGSKNGNNEYIITKENITENTSFEYTVTDGQGNTQTKTAVINTIDKNPPADFTIAAENTAEGLKITGTTTDNESGIDKYEYYAKKSTDSDYTKYDNNPITGLASGTYSVYAIAYDKAENQKQSTNIVEVKIARTYSNITAQMVAEHPETYYGLKVTNYESQNGQNDWKIFYSDWKENPDNAHIFLITSGYADLAKAGRLDVNTSMKISDNQMNAFNGAKYYVFWENIPEYEAINQEIKNRFNVGNAIHGGKTNAACISKLLNSNYWEKYKDNGEMAEFAIGGATLEMWINSWNSLYENNGDKLYYFIPDDLNSWPGYYVGIKENEKTTSIDISSKKGYSNKLYFPYSDIPRSYGYTYYWLASPSADYGGKRLRIIDRDGIISELNYKNSSSGIRPVVSLNKEITVNAEDAE